MTAEPTPKRASATRTKLGVALRVAAAPVITFVAYLLLVALFDLVAKSDGLLSADGSVSLFVALLGAIVLALRLGLFFVVLPLVVYRIVARALLGAPLRGAAGPPP